MQSSSQVGSEGWIGGEAYSGDDDYRLRIESFQSSFSTTNLLAQASSLRGDIKCSLSGTFSVGSFNFVRKITFADGAEWVARLRMPSIDRPDEGITDALRYKMQSEVDTMKFIRQNTKIPVPRVHGYNFEENDVGAPYILMDYIHGNTAAELSETIEGDHEDIPDQYFEKFMRQVADIMAELASIRFPKIGSIIETPEGQFEISKLEETRSGPYSSTKEFYDNYPVELAKILWEDSKPDGISGEEHNRLPSLFRKVMAEIDLAEEIPSFGLVNMDFGPGNILVDHEFNILSVIDWDSVISCPDAVLHYFPYLSGMGDVRPGMTEGIHPAFKKRRERSHIFAALASAADQERNGDDRKITTKGFYSREAVAFRAMGMFKTRQDWVIRNWIDGLEYLEGKEDSDIQQFYLASL